MLYAMIAKDRPDALERRLAVRPEHLEHLQSLGKKLVFAGALYGPDDKPNGSLIVFEAENLAQAEHLAASDPFVSKKIFAAYSVQRWTWTLNNPEGRGQ